jgi:hypothetical protein
MFTWNMHTFVCAVLILLAGQIRLLAYKQLGLDFTFTVHKPEKLDKTGIYRMEHLSMWRKLFTTDHGYLGNSAASLEMGGEIWALAGASVPLLLRPVVTGYRLIAEAYVHGIMHGEAVEDSVGSSHVQTIIIV